MSDIIRLLPDSVANQIAAGEVIQRPASVVKELLENAIDAGATTISVNVKDAGRTIIQVIDNGCGMSGTDARMAFERHSTSKFSKADDLFAIKTLGFRGEALASIAAVYEVVLKSKRMEDEVGTRIEINASEVVSQEPVSCMNGSNFLVRNLFYNVPARRKFLKADTTELKHIISEFYRVVLTRPEIEFILMHNGTEIYNLPVSNLKHRIIRVFGSAVNQQLIPIQTDTSIVKVQGFIGTPESARKTYGEQFFFVNRRYMRHPYFHKAVTESYEQVLPPESYPSYFIYLESPPESIDINIHPTKTEIKFEDEKAIFHILLASVREALGKHNIVPSLDFNEDATIDIPVFRKDEKVVIPEIEINPDYNPFDKQWSGDQSFASRPPASERLKNWELLYKGADEDQQERSGDIYAEHTVEPNLHKFVQIRNRYIVTPVKSGLLVIDQKRAHERILYDRYMSTLSSGSRISQQDLYPATVRLNAADHALLMEIFDDICSLGFDIRDLGNQSIVINGLPADIKEKNTAELIDEFLEYYKQTESDIKSKAKEKLALSMAKASSIPYNRTLDNKEMRELTDQLFASKEPALTQDGKRIYFIWQSEELEKRFS